MALVLMSGLRGGVGTTTLAANLAMTLATLGHQCAVLAFSARSTLGMHFGLDPCQPLPGFAAPAAATGPINGVRLLDLAQQAGSGDLAEGLASGDFSFAGDVIYLADLSEANEGMAAQLRAYCEIELLVFTPAAECLYSLPAVLEKLPADVGFVLNRCDDAKRLGRHAGSFARALLGERIVATIQADEAVCEAGAMMQPLARHAPASAALADMAELASRLASLPRQHPSVSAPASQSDAA
jgi:chromosome partitioning protein